MTEFDQLSDAGKQECIKALVREIQKLNKNHVSSHAELLAQMNKLREMPGNCAALDAAIKAQAEVPVAKLTTDEWVEKFCPKFRQAVDDHISMLTELNAEEAYTLRRLIMISLRAFLAGHL